nr:PREDICTED: uncharacterized protein LOC106704183 [Latimeria chalumnae]|eukprot:XP_014346098.1 PREDICTED: uncharacterized protein LOC106704183 [Latimeria chalumnae]
MYMRLRQVFDSYLTKSAQQQPHGIACDLHQSLTYSWKTSVPSSRRQTSKTRKHKLSMKLNVGTENDVESEQSRRNFMRKRKHLVEKLEVIYTMLCGITNMKCRDLKTMCPLPPTYVNTLLKDIQNEKNFSWSGIPRQASSHPLQTIKKQQQTSTPIQEDLYFGAVELLWENFIHEAPLSPLSSDSRRWSNKTQGQGRFSYGGPRKIKVGPKEGTIDVNDLPPWLALIVDETSALEALQKKPKDKTETILKQRSEFAELQQSVNSMMEKKIAEKRQNRTTRLTTLLLTVKPKLGGLSTLLSALKSGTKNLEPAMFHSLWFRLLKNSSLELVGDKDEEIRSQLGKLERFHSYTAQSWPYAKEKLCLLALSLPADKLLRLEVQDALLFIVEHLFQMSSRQLKHWYQYRKLPFTVLT